MPSCAWVTFFLGLIVFSLKAEQRPYAAYTPGNFVVYADDRRVAEEARIEAQKVLYEFNQFFGIDAGKSLIPIVLVFGPSPDRAESELHQGSVRIYHQKSNIKLQVNWYDLPVSFHSFHHGWVRALCVRRAWMFSKAQASKTKGDKPASELRVPAWITMGITLLLTEDRWEEEIEARALLLARIKPDLSINETLQILSENQLGPSQRILSGMLCRELTKDPRARARLAQSLNWNSNTSPREWMSYVLDEKDLDLWWQKLWNSKAKRFSWFRLSYANTLDWILALENNHASGRVQNVSPQIASIAHPWFRPWVNELLRSESMTTLSPLRKDIQLRRNAALSWLNEFEYSEAAPVHDYLAWRALYGSPEVSSSPADGPIRTWFDSIVR